MQKTTPTDKVKPKNDHIAELRFNANNISCLAGKADDTIKKMAKISAIMRATAHDMTLGVGSTLSSQSRGTGLRDDANKMIEKLNSAISEYISIVEIIENHIVSTKEYNDNHHN